MSRATGTLALIPLLVIILAVVQSVQGTPVNNADLGSNNGNQIIYRRWVRRRPSDYPTDLYVDEVVEEFHVQRRPPAHIITDEELDRIIRCDFEPTLKECEQLIKPQIPMPTPKPVLYPLSPPLIVEPIYIPRPWTPTPNAMRPDSTTGVPETVFTTRSTTSTTRSIPLQTTTTTSTTTATPTTTTEDLPFLPDIHISEEEITKEPDSYTELEDNDLNNEYVEQIENATEAENPEFEVVGDLPENEFEVEESEDNEEPDDYEEENEYDDDNNL